MAEKTFKIGKSIFKFKKLPKEKLYYSEGTAKKFLHGEGRILVEADLNIRRVTDRIEEIFPYALFIENPHKEDLEKELLDFIKKVEEEKEFVMFTLTDLTFFGCNPSLPRRISDSIKKLMPKKYKAGTLSYVKTGLRNHYPVKITGKDKIEYYDISLFTSGKSCILFKEVNPHQDKNIQGVKKLHRDPSTKPAHKKVLHRQES